MKKIKIGVVGLGRGLDFVQAIKNMDDVELTAVCDTDEKSIEKAKDRLPGTAQTFEDFDEFIDCKIDAVILAESFHMHAAHAIIALGKGIHVLSETTAAPTLGECVKLCEAVEASGCKYMLATNVPHMPGPMELTRLYKGQAFGRVLYAEGEYFHASAPGQGDIYAPTRYHWRNYLPRTYYNMHDLGTLMVMTGTVPKKVNAKAIFAPDLVRAVSKNRMQGDVASIVLTEMDNGAIFRTTAHASLEPSRKWFRLCCERGTIESQRGDQDTVLYNYCNATIPEGMKKYDIYKAPVPEMNDEIKKAGHGGTDYFLDKYFVEYLRGEVEPFFDVYRSVALSATGILAWRSVLNNGCEYEIPDFRDKEARRAVANDFLTPFPNPDGSGITLPCSSKPMEQ